MDKTKTPMVKRLLEKKMLMPDTVQEKIENNLNTVQFFYDNQALTEELRCLLDPIRELERSLGRMLSGIENPRDLGVVKEGLCRLLEVKTLKKPVKKKVYFPWTSCL